jgi:glycosyltransferase involved in cell wall biosynthesis
MEAATTPFFSIVLPVYNRAGLIADAIRSVIHQNFRDWELVIIDDASTDGTEDVIAPFKSPSIRYYRNSENQERSNSRNKGIELSRGAYICFLDSDDLYLPEHLQGLYEAITRFGTAPAMFYTGCIRRFPEHEEPVPLDCPPGLSPVEFAIRYQIPCISACIEASILKEHRFNPSLRINEDVDLFARIAAHFPLVTVREATTMARIHGDNTRDQVRDYISPQIEAVSAMFRNPQLKGHISPRFRRETMAVLYHQLINFLAQRGEYARMNLYILRYLRLRPFDRQNKSRLVLLLYHLPGGFLIRKLVAYLKQRRQP